MLLVLGRPIYRSVTQFTCFCGTLLSESSALLLELKDRLQLLALSASAPSPVHLCLGTAGSFSFISVSNYNLEAGLSLPVAVRQWLTPSLVLVLPTPTGC